MGNYPSGEGTGKGACFVALLPGFHLKGKVGMGIEEMVACFVALLPYSQMMGKVGMGIEERAYFVALLPCFQMKGKVGMGIEEMVAYFVALLPCFQMKGREGIGIEEMVACFVALLPFLQFEGKVGMGRNSARLGLPLKEMGIEERVACFVALLPRFQSMKRVGMGIEDGVADFVVQNSAVHLGLPLIEKVGMGIVAHLVVLDFLQLMGKEKVAFAPLGSHQNQGIQMLVGGTSL